MDHGAELRAELKTIAVLLNNAEVEPYYRENVVIVQPDDKEGPSIQWQNADGWQVVG